MGDGDTFGLENCVPLGNGLLTHSPVADPDLQIRKGGVDPDLEIRGETRSQKKKFRPFGPQIGLKIRGGGPPTPPLDQPLLTHTTSPSLVGRNVEIKRRHSTLSLALACALPFGLRFAPSKSHLLQLFHRCSTPGGFWLPLFLFSVGVHLETNLGSLSIGILRT